MERSRRTAKRRGLLRYSTRALIFILIVLVAAFIFIAVPKPVLKLDDIPGITLTDPVGNTSTVSESSFSL